METPGALELAEESLNLSSSEEQESSSSESENEESPAITDNTEEKEEEKENTANEIIKDASKEEEPKKNPLHHRPILTRSPRIKPQRQKRGAVVQHWNFNFGAALAVTALESGKPAAALLKTADHTTAIKKEKKRANKTPPSANSVSSPILSMDQISSQEASPVTTTEQGHRRKYGRLHTTKVGYLLKKYLGGDECAVNHHEEQPALENNQKERIAKVKRLSRSEVKPIMQVKSEQDAALRELEHAPRQFHAKPVPLSTVVPPPNSVTTVEKTQKNSEKRRSSANTANNDDVPTIAGAVPVSAVEPRYAMMVADSVLKKYNSEPMVVIDEAVADMPAAVKRPSSARPQRQRTSISQAHFLPEIAEEDS